ncbi:hypothetical protein R5R35_011101 [Gryllus longicercus]|uniref:Accessory gland protein n=1 Tax=Gryllus longicercus TaxID=2509291 RepID=A0AAN9VUL5_9ORTH
MHPPTLRALLRATFLLLLIGQGDSDAKHLARRRRYIVFPEGASLQLVFEMAVPTVNLRPRPFIMSWTIGTAWELPGDASQIVEKFKLPKMKEPPPPPPTTMPPDYHFHHHDWDYHDNLAMGPPTQMEYTKKQKGADSKVYYETYTKKKPYSYKGYYYKGYPGYSSPHEVRLHRRHRRDAFLTMESVLLSTGLGGRACVLRALCEAGQRRDGSAKSSFLTELLHVLFTLPPDLENGKDVSGEHSDVLQHYDAARAASGDCGALYSECSTSLFALWAPDGSL